MKRKFLFLDARIPGNKKDARITDPIRAHAMREYRRKQRLEMVRKHQESLGSATEASAEVDVRAVSPNASPASTGLSTDLISHASLAMDLVDPFDSMSVRLPAHYQALLSHFLHDIGPLLLPGDPRDIETSWTAQWLQFAISRPTLLMATCCHAATHIDAISGRDRSVSTLRLQAMTTAALNRSLEGGPTDEVIGTVMMMGADAVCRNSSIREIPSP
nr:hypothetical protein CFP56_13138 [Quercus suber]